MLYRYMVFSSFVVMVPFCMMIIFWTKEKYQEYERQLMSEENLLLIRMMENIESEMSSLKKTSEQILLDDKISPYRLGKGGFYTIEALDQLAYYCQGMDIFEDLLICLNGENEVYRTGGKELFTTLSQTFTLGGDLTAENLYELLDSKTYFSFLDTSEFLLAGKRHKNMITYPLHSFGGECYGTLVCLISMDYFQEILQVSELTSDTIICNNAGEVLFSTNSQTRDTLNLQEMFENDKTEENFYRTSIQGERYRTVVHHSDLTEWYYIRMVSQEVLTTRQTQEVLPFTCILLLFSLLIASIIGVLSAFYNYLPVRSLLRLFNPNISYSAKRDELSLLNLYVRNLQTESSSMKKQLATKELQQVREIFTEILYGGNTVTEADRELLEKYGFREHTCGFCIVLLALPEGLSEEDFEYQLKQPEFEELFFITRELGGGYICLYSAPKGTKLAVRKLEELNRKMQDEGYHLHASVGQYTEAFSGLRDSLNESLLAAELDSDSPAACLDCALKNNVQEYWRPSKEELLLELAVRNGDKEEILKSSRKLEEQLSTTLRYYRSNEMRYVFYRIMNYLVVFSKDIGRKEDTSDLLVTMLECKSIKDFFASFRRCAELLLENSCVLARKVKGRQMQEIKDFVDINFHLPEMSLSYTAEHFAIKDSYLSKLFKENIGENFIDYLLRKRLEEAVRLLRETDLPVKQVVKSVGYEDVTSFIKKFSGKFGTTPGMYRKMLRAEEKGL